MLWDLAVTPVSEVLRRVSADRSSGDLEVRAGKVVKTIFFDHGRVVFGASNLKKERLGESLVAIGRITDEQYQRASALMGGDRKRRFGEALVQAGILEKAEVGRLVARQVKRIVLSLFELSSGAAAFEERRCPIPLEYMLSLSLHRMLYVGIKSMKAPPLVLGALGNLDRWVTLAAVPPFRFGVRKCSQEEKEILEHCKRRVTIRRLAWESGGLSNDRLRLTYALLASGVLIDTERPAAEPQPIIQMETSTFLLSALQRRPDPSARDLIRQEVEEELARSANLDREKWLRVSRAAPREELVKALEEKMERYHALLEATGDEPALKTDIELILGRAASMLRLARQAPPAEARAEAPAASAGPAAEAPAPKTPAAAAGASATPAPEDASERRGDPTWPPKSDVPAPAPPAAENQAGALQGTAQLEYLLMEGNVRMTVSDYANAVKVFQRLSDLAPEVAAFHVKLAVAMACYPRTQKQAEREFFEAVRLEPNNADIHYQFGLYYKAMKVRSRAIAELRTAVSINPRHKHGRDELEQLSPKDSALTSLKKLFR